LKTKIETCSQISTRLLEGREFMEQSVTGDVAVYFGMTGIRKRESLKGREQQVSCPR
jgi:hypothetical protein